MSNNTEEPKKQENKSTFGEMLAFIEETKDGKYSSLEKGIIQTTREEYLDLSEFLDEDCSYYYNIY